MKKNTLLLFSAFILPVSLLTLVSCSISNPWKQSYDETSSSTVSSESISVSEADPLENYLDYEFVLPEYDGRDQVVLNQNKPCFSKEERTPKDAIKLSELDELGRCGTAYSCVGRDMLPTEERGQIGMIKPAGWQTVKYDFVDGGYLYNRCHLIAFELCGINADKRNLITGTRYMNIIGMRDIEDKICGFVRYTGMHVCYRVTPRYIGSELLPRGVEMEAFSVEDNGKEICIHLFCFNVQPGVVID